jgi:hypothetical protein
MTIALAELEAMGYGHHRQIRRRVTLHRMTD